MNAAELRLAAAVAEDEGPEACVLRRSVRQYLREGYAFQDALRLAVALFVHQERGGPPVVLLAADERQPV